MQNRNIAYKHRKNPFQATTLGSKVLTIAALNKQTTGSWDGKSSVTSDNSNIFSQAKDITMSNPGSVIGRPQQQLVDKLFKDVSSSSRDGESPDENVSSDDSERGTNMKHPGLDQEDQRISAGDKCAPNIQNEVNLLNKNKMANPDLYSFSKNIDYEKITKSQKRKFLKRQVIVPIQNISQQERAMAKLSTEQKMKLTFCEEMQTVISEKYSENTHTKAGEKDNAQVPKEIETNMNSKSKMKRINIKGQDNPKVTVLHSQSPMVKKNIPRAPSQKKLKRDKSDKENPVNSKFKPNANLKKVNMHLKNPSESSNGFKVSEHRTMLDQFGSSVFGSSISQKGNGSILGISKTIRPANDINVSKVNSFHYLSPTANSKNREKINFQEIKERRESSQKRAASRESQRSKSKKTARGGSKALDAPLMVKMAANQQNFRYQANVSVYHQSTQLEEPVLTRYQKVLEQYYPDKRQTEKIASVEKPEKMVGEDIAHLFVYEKGKDTKINDETGSNAEETRSEEEEQATQLDSLKKADDSREDFGGDQGKEESKEADGQKHAIWSQNFIDEERRQAPAAETVDEVGNYDMSTINPLSSVDETDLKVKKQSSFNVSSISKKITEYYQGYGSSVSKIFEATNNTFLNITKDNSVGDILDESPQNKHALGPQRKSKLQKPAQSPSTDLNSHGKTKKMLTSLTSELITSGDDVSIPNEEFAVYEGHNYMRTDDQFKHQQSTDQQPMVSQATSFYTSEETQFKCGGSKTATATPKQFQVDQRLVHVTSTSPLLKPANDNEPIRDYFLVNQQRNEILEIDQRSMVTDENLTDKDEDESYKSPDFGNVRHRSVKQMRKEEIMGCSEPVEILPGGAEPACECVDCVDETGEPVVDQPADNDSLLINFESLCQQQQILMQLRDLLEIRPSQLQEQNLMAIDPSQSIGGLSAEANSEVQTLCQSWWDITQQDQSIVIMSLNYQQSIQEEFFKQQSQNESDMSTPQKTIAFNRNIERSECMRRFCVLKSAVVGLTAFYTMLTRSDEAVDNSPPSHERSNYTPDLEIRRRLNQLFKIIYDQFILVQSYSLGCYTDYNTAVDNTASWENKLYRAYQEHIHLLFINKKIQNEDDYLIFNTKKTIPGLEADAVIVNQPNRDYQLNQLSQRLEQNCLALIENELAVQTEANNLGNVNLLNTIMDIVLNSKQIDFQQGKNLIYEGITESEVMPDCNSDPTSRNSSNGLLDPVNRPSEIKSVPCIDLDEEWQRQLNKEQNQCNSSETPQYASQSPSQQKSHLIKNLANDQNQIIHEESREESECMNISQSMQSGVQDTTGNISFVDGIKKQVGSTGTSLNQTRYVSVVGIGKESKEINVVEFKQDSAERRLEKKESTKSLAEDEKSAELNCSEAFDVENAAINVMKSEQLPHIVAERQGRKYTLVLDLDETLIHCQEIKEQQTEGEPQTMIKFLKRPGLSEFLEEMSVHFEIIIFTASTQEYADAVIDSLPCKEVISHRLYWDHLTVFGRQEPSQKDGIGPFSMTSDGGADELNDISEGGPEPKQSSPFSIAEPQEPSASIYFKDISRLGRPLESIIIVDNEAQNFDLQPQNGIQIKEWRGDPDDSALEELGNVLIHCVERCEDGNLIKEIVKQ